MLPPKNGREKDLELSPVEWLGVFLIGVFMALFLFYTL